MAKQKAKTAQSKAVSTDTAKVVRPVGRPTDYSDTMPTELLAAMANGDSVTQFAASIGVSRECIYEWGRVHSEFSDALTRGKILSQGYWEKELRVLMTDPRANAPLVKLYFANRFNWHDKVSNELSGPNGGAIPIQEIRRVIVDPKEGQC